MKKLKNQSKKMNHLNASVISGADKVVGGITPPKRRSGTITVLDTDMES